MELWMSDGTEAGTVLIKDINRQGATSGPSGFTHAAGTTFFSADDGVSGSELWKTDGTVAGTQQVADIFPGFHGSQPRDFRDLGGQLLFQANDGVAGKELHRSDGTASGTTLVADLNPETGGAYINFDLLQVGGGTVFFGRATEATGMELWKSDGTEAGTVLVKDIIPGPVGSNAFPRADVVGILFFTVHDSGSNQLWKSDGTAAGTVLVKEGVSPGRETVVNGVLFFTNYHETNGTELWKSDGTEAGTVMVADINPGAANTSFAGLTAHNGMLFFGADDGIHGMELWKSDGTSEGTVLVADIDPGPDGSLETYYPDYQIDIRTFYPEAVGNTLYFAAETPNEGVELWKSDGTPGGTVLVKDIFPSPNGGLFHNGEYHFRSLTEAGGTLFFSANDGTHGYELWSSDGTSAGTALTADIRPGPNDSRPDRLANSNGTLFFAADDGSRGRELWKVSTATSPTVNIPVGETTVQVFEDNGDLVVEGSAEFFRAPLGSIPGIVINGSADSEKFLVNVDNLSSAFLPDSITINAGEGASDDDTLVVNGTQTVSNYEYTTGGPESGTIELDGLEIIFSQFEPIIDNLPVTNRRFNCGTSGGLTIRVADDGVAGNGLSTLDDGGTGMFESLTFTSPTNSFQIAAGDGSDTITVSQLDAAFGAVLTVLLLLSEHLKKGPHICIVPYTLGLDRRIANQDPRFR